MKNITKEQKDQTKVISFQIFHDFTDGVSINDLVDKFNESCPEGWKIKISRVNFWLLELPYKIIFDLIDKDKDTKITAEELGPALRACGASPSQQELEMAIQSSGDKSNLINFEKFIDLYEKLINNQDSEEDIIDELKKLDKNGNGNITVNDLKNLLANFGEVLTKEEIDDIIQESNADKSGNINIENFAKILLGKI